MFVRARAPRYANHRAALRDCRGVLAMFAASLAALVAVVLDIQLTSGIFVAEVHTRVPGLIVAAVIALGAQAAAIGVYYHDHLMQQRRKTARAIREHYRCDECVPLVFDRPRQRAHLT